MKTMTIPANAKTRGSGNQRSLQVASANPKRAKPLSRWAEFGLRPDDTDCDGIAPPCLPGIRPLYCGRIAALARRYRDYHLASQHRRENEESTCRASRSKPRHHIAGRKQQAD